MLAFISHPRSFKAADNDRRGAEGPRRNGRRTSLISFCRLFSGPHSHITAVFKVQRIHCTPTLLHTFVHSVCSVYG